jgi:signal transduction histidine kinase
MTGIRRSTLTGCLIAVVGTGAMAAVRATIGEVVGHDFPLLPFILSIMVSAWYGGLVPGLLATALGAAVGVYYFIAPAGSFWIDDAADVLRVAIFLGEGVVISALCGALLTARRRAEAYALDADEKKRQLEVKDRYKNEFLAALAHEVRNPLSTIRTTLAVLRAKGLDDDARQRSREVMERQVAVVSRFMDDLADSSQICQGKVRLQTKLLDLAEVADRAVEVSRHLIESHRHRLDIQRPSGPVPVRGDPIRLTQVVTNLLANAAKYTPEGGDIRLAVATEAGVAVVRVVDNGLGIPPESLPRIFDLGEQVERNLARSEGGLGIGLSVVRRLVEMHGGSVRALSDGPGHGCEFVVRLPLVPAATPSRVQTGPGPRPCRAAGSRRHILVVDDNRDAADSLAMLLSLKGDAVRTANSGREALQAAGEEPPDVVFLDIGMSDLNGYEVARQLRQQPGLSGAVLVAVSGHGSDGDRLRSKAEGFHAHLVKPVEPAAVDELLAE